MGPRRLAVPPRLLFVLGAWGLVVGAIQLYAWREMLSPAEVVGQLVLACRSGPAGPLLFVGVAALSPLLLVPAGLLGGLAGACFGPVLGVLYTLLGCNLSALLTYGLGRLSRQEHGRLARLCARYGPRLQRRPLLSVIVLRLSFLPYDPVNYLVGLLHVRLGPFLLGNTLGSLPGVVAIVLAGNVVGSIGDGAAGLNPAILLSAVVLMAASAVLAVVLRRRSDRGV
ncbi:MAG TPA: VTT domain-containing protein [Chloroflexaceae bacterium]|nr:VTT domain-containing protein [Chloroflexaceae bacterium]